LSFLGLLIAMVLTVVLIATVHEIGHYWVAKRLGIGVEVFSIGVGRPIYTWVSNETRFQLGWIPLGAYTKYYQANDLPNPELVAYSLQAIWRRFLVVIAGPFMNFLFALVVLFSLSVYGVPSNAPQLGWITPDSPAQAAGLVKGSVISEVNGVSPSNWREVNEVLTLAALSRDVLSMSVERDGIKSTHFIRYDPATVLTTGKVTESLGLLGVHELAQPVIGRVKKSSVAANAGLEIGDRIISINGRAVSHWHEFSSVVRSSPNALAEISVSRGGKVTDIELVAPENSLGYGVIGVEGLRKAVVDRYTHSRNLGLAEALAVGIKDIFYNSVITIRFITSVFSGELSLKNISFPVPFTEGVATGGELLVIQFLGFLCVLNIVVGVVNLIPLPSLDGGKLVLMVCETVLRKPLGSVLVAGMELVGMLTLSGMLILAFIYEASLVFG